MDLEDRLFNKNEYEIELQQNKRMFPTYKIRNKDNTFYSHSKDRAHLKVNELLLANNLNDTFIKIYEYDYSANVYNEIEKIELKTLFEKNIELDKINFIGEAYSQKIFIIELLFNMNTILSKYGKGFFKVAAYNFMKEQDLTTKKIDELFKYMSDENIMVDIVFNNGDIFKNCDISISRKLNSFLNNFYEKIKLNVLKEDIELWQK